MTKLVRYAPRGYRSPFGVDFNRLFSDVFPYEGDQDEPSVWRPRVDISESESAFTVVADLPGVDKEAVTVNFEDDVLTISGERRNETEEKTANYYRTERIYGRFSRSFTFPKGVEVDNISAKFDNGVLTVSVPKTADSKPRTIAVK